MVCRRGDVIKIHNNAVVCLKQNIFWISFVEFKLENIYNLNL